jgi:hypothetical protein
MNYLSYEESSIRRPLVTAVSSADTAASVFFGISDIFDLPEPAGPTGAETFDPSTGEGITSAIASATEAATAIPDPEPSPTSRRIPASALTGLASAGYILVSPDNQSAQHPSGESSTAINRKLVADLVRVSNLLRRGQVDEARLALITLHRENPSNSELSRWIRVIATPIAKSSNRATGHSVKATSEWLRTHSNEFRNKWIALKAGNLLGAGSSRKALRDTVKRDFGLHGVIFFYIEP